MNQSRATFFGFLAAPVFAGLVVATNIALSMTNNPLVAVLIAPVCVAASGAAEVFIGVPLYLLGSRANLVKWWTSAIAGAVTAIAAITIVNLASGANLEPSNLANVLSHNAIFAGPVGALSGLVFWLFWRRGDLRSLPPGPSAGA